MNMLGVMPANAGIQNSLILLMRVVWTPAPGLQHAGTSFAGVTMTFHTA